MSQTWEETQLLLESLRQEYLIISQELEITGDRQYRKQLHKWATNCLREFDYIVNQYAKHQLDQDLPTQDPNQ